MGMGNILKVILKSGWATWSMG